MHGYTLRYLVLCALLAVSAVAGHLASGRDVGQAGGSAPDWSDWPMHIDGWQGQQVPVNPETARYLQADAMMRVLYEKEGRKVAFSAIYGTHWRSLHSPAGCFPSQGWQTLERKPVTLPAPPDSPHPGPLQAEQLLVEKKGLRMLALYLYAHPGGTTSSWVEQCLRVARSGMKAGGIVIMVEAPCAAAGRQQAYDDELKLIQALYPYVVRMWYGE
ncbi:MAG: EpsI family protein [Armatimonadetes bacterium]|nr:EpsI family protein [Armatimonadota bacterium]